MKTIVKNKLSNGSQVKTELLLIPKEEEIIIVNGSGDLVATLSIQLDYKDNDQVSCDRYLVFHNHQPTGFDNNISYFQDNKCNNT